MEALEVPSLACQFIQWFEPLCQSLSVLPGFPHFRAARQYGAEGEEAWENSRRHAEGWQRWRQCLIPLIAFRKSFTGFCEVRVMAVRCERSCLASLFQHQSEGWRMGRQYTFLWYLPEFWKCCNEKSDLHVLSFSFLFLTFLIITSLIFSCLSLLIFPFLFLTFLIISFLIFSLLVFAFLLYTFHFSTFLITTFLIFSVLIFAILIYTCLIFSFLSLFDLSFSELSFSFLKFSDNYFSYLFSFDLCFSDLYFSDRFFPFLIFPFLSSPFLFSTFLIITFLIFSVWSLLFWSSLFFLFLIFPFLSSPFLFSTVLIITFLRFFISFLYLSDVSLFWCFFFCSSPFCDFFPLSFPVVILKLRNLEKISATPCLTNIYM